MSRLGKGERKSPKLGVSMVFIALFALDLDLSRAGRGPPGWERRRRDRAPPGGAERGTQAAPGEGGPRTKGRSRPKAEPERSTRPERPGRCLPGPRREQRAKAGRGAEALRPGPQERATARRPGGGTPAQSGRARAGRDGPPVAGPKRPGGRRPTPKGRTESRATHLSARSGAQLLCAERRRTADTSGGRRPPRANAAQCRLRHWVCPFALPT